MYLDNLYNLLNFKVINVIFFVSGPMLTKLFSSNVENFF